MTRRALKRLRKHCRRQHFQHLLKSAVLPGSEAFWVLDHVLVPLHAPLATGPDVDAPGRGLRDELRVEAFSDPRVGPPLAVQLLPSGSFFMKLGIDRMGGWERGRGIDT